MSVKNEKLMTFYCTDSANFINLFIAGMLSIYQYEKKS